MANDCCGTMRVVSKSKEAIERFSKIMNYEDDEFFCYRCRGFTLLGEIYESMGFFVADFDCDSAWSSGPWFDHDEDKNSLIVKKYDKNLNPIYGTAHITSIPNLAKKLGFGIEMWTEEPGCCFSEHAICNSRGEYMYDTAELRCEEKENDEDMDDEFEYINDFGEEYGRFCDPDEIFDGNPEEIVAD